MNPFKKKGREREGERPLCKQKEERRHLEMDRKKGERERGVCFDGTLYVVKLLSEPWGHGYGLVQTESFGRKLP